MKPQKQSPISSSHSRGQAMPSRLSATLMALLASYAITMCAASPTPATTSQQGTPGLLLNIMVRGLDNGTLEMLREAFATNGFERLMRDGLQVDALQYGTQDPVAAAAMLQTGASPRTNGILSATTYDPATGTVASVMADNGELGNFTDAKYSPKTLQVSNISDEIRIASAGVARTYAVGVDAEEALLAAGHAGSCAIWLDNSAPRWASTTYYKDIPTLLQKRNYSQPLQQRLDTMRWSPSAATNALTILPENKRKYTFTYIFPAKDAGRYDAFRLSPLANREVTDVAIDLIQTLSTPASGATDMVGVTYDLSPYPYTRSADQRHELYDAYVKLDADLARLISAAERRAGANNVVVMLSGLPADTKPRRDDEQWRVPSGTFSPRKAQGLLNMYLMAKYGSGNWVKGYHSGHFYLNRDLIDKQSVDLAAMRADAAMFVAQMSGVDRALPLESLLTTTTEYINPTSAGDIYIEISPGWEIEGATSRHGTPRPGGVERAAVSAMPFFLLAPGREPKRKIATADARRVAPTVCRVLRIRSPGGASQPAL